MVHILVLAILGVIGPHKVYIVYRVMYGTYCCLIRCYV